MEVRTDERKAFSPSFEKGRTLGRNFLALSFLALSFLTLSAENLTIEVIISCRLNLRCPIRLAGLEPLTDISSHQGQNNYELPLFRWPGVVSEAFSNHLLDYLYWSIVLLTNNKL